MRVEYGNGEGAFDWLAFDSSAFDTGNVPLSDDVLGATGVRLKYGIDGNGPTDLVAGTGELQCVLRNDNLAGTIGRYSPNHANAISSWMYGVLIRCVFTYNSVNYVKFTGKLRVIDPEPGRYRGRKVAITAYDSMRDLAEADAREVAVQTNKAEDELLDALVAVMPTSAQPYATDFNAGVDTYPYSFDKVAGGTKVLSVMRDIVVSSLGMLFQKGNGTLCYRSRHTLATGSSLATFDNTMVDLSVPSSLDGVFNRVRVTVHPKTISAAATEELYTLPSGASIEMAAGATTEVWTDYTDPDDRQVKIGGTSVVTVLVGGTHYAANSQADGLGSNMTSSITATVTPFGSTAKWSLTNGASSTTFITVLKVIGKAVRDVGPQTFQSYEAEDYGDRPIDIDLPYQDDPYIGQSAAHYLRQQYSDLAQQVGSITFIANASNANMTAAMQVEPGDRVTVSEYVTGLTSVQCIVQSVEFEVQQGIYIVCRWGVRPANTTLFWQWGIAGASEWGATTVYAF